MQMREKAINNEIKIKIDIAKRTIKESNRIENTGITIKESNAIKIVGSLTRTGDIMIMVIICTNIQDTIADQIINIADIGDTVMIGIATIEKIAINTIMEDIIVIIVVS